MNITLTLPFSRDKIPKVRAVRDEGNIADRAPKPVRFVRQVVRAAWKTVKNFARDVYHHAEAIVLLVLASIGLNYLLQEIPMTYSMPFWIEAAMVIPVISVIGVQLLTWSAAHRAKKRGTNP